jgi:hypothetical protein
MLPLRGAGVRELGLPLPPADMPLRRGGRWRKRWRYVGVYGPDLMLCVGAARIGPAPLRFWAVVEPGRPVLEGTSMRRGGVRLEGPRVVVESPRARIDLTLSAQEGWEPVEVASPAGSAFIWTRKEIALARGTVEVDGRRHEVEGDAVVDDSAGYHDRHTAWRWSAGIGRAAAGERVAWNLVAGVHDAEHDSERTLWVEGAAREVAPAAFATGLSRVETADGGALDFTEWGARADDTNLLVFRSRYRQPFGGFSGTLPGGLELSEGYGVMEEHEARW